MPGLQEGENLGMPHAEGLPLIGSRCGALRIRDQDHNWRIVYRIDDDAVVILDVYAKKTKSIPQEVIDRCKTRLKNYEEASTLAAKERLNQGAKEPRKRR